MYFGNSIGQDPGNENEMIQRENVTNILLIKALRHTDKECWKFLGLDRCETTLFPGSEQEALVTENLRNLQLSGIPTWQEWWPLVKDCNHSQITVYKKRAEKWTRPGSFPSHSVMPYVGQINWKPECKGAHWCGSRAGGGGGSMRDIQANVHHLYYLG